jgi:hypothetical protein
MGERLKSGNVVVHITCRAGDEYLKEWRANIRKSLVKPGLRCNGTGEIGAHCLLLEGHECYFADTEVVSDKTELLP